MSGIVALMKLSMTSNNPHHAESSGTETLHTNSNSAPHVPHSVAPGASSAPHSGQRSLRIAPHTHVSAVSDMGRSQTGQVRGWYWWKGSPQRPQEAALSRTRKPQEGQAKVPPSATKIAPQDLQLIASSDRLSPQTGHLTAGSIGVPTSVAGVGNTGRT